MKRWTNNLILLCTLLPGLPALGQSPDSAQGFSSTETQGAEKTRRPISKVAPVYSPAMKRFNISGTVRLNVKISPQGTVQTVSPLGGNPILIEAAVTAVKRWKYTPASSDTETQITIVFNINR
jgi:TonB family protein